MESVKPTVYIETSVISYYTAKPSRDLIVAAHQQITHEWWEQALPECDPRISEIVIAEADRGDSEAASRRRGAIASMPALLVTEDVIDLANSYFREIGMSEVARADSYHMALAAWHGVDYLVTWNLRHIAAARVRRAVAMVNSRRGIRTPEICTPEQLMEL